jgi:hypothetical protein
MNDNRSLENQNLPRTRRLPWGGILGVLGIAFGAAVWTMGALQPTPEEDPNWVPLTAHQNLQAQLDQAVLQQQQTEQQYRQCQQRLALVQKSQTELSAQLRDTLALDQIPAELRAASPPLTAVNIQRLWKDQQTFSPRTVNALLQCLVQIIDTGIINTTRPADDADTQELYRAVQLVLRSVDIYQGEVTGDQKTTFEALTNFQRRSKLKVDGKMGMKTFGALAEKFQNNIAARDSS